MCRNNESTGGVMFRNICVPVKGGKKHASRMENAFLTAGYQPTAVVSLYGGKTCFYFTGQKEDEELYTSRRIRNVATKYFSQNPDAVDADEPIELYV